MRVISGKFRRKKLFSVPGSETRPTTDRIRESVFNILSREIQGKSVLDLFAGTGALGIEAVSRGALSCVFVDFSRAAETIVKKNIGACGLKEEATVVRHDILKNLDCLKRLGRRFNLVFMDPPYARNCVGKTIENLAASGTLENHAMVVVEHSPMEKIPNNLPGFETVDQRNYGKKTAITFMQYHTNTDTAHKGTIDS